MSSESDDEVDFGRASHHSAAGGAAGGSVQQMLAAGKDPHANRPPAVALVSPLHPTSLAPFAGPAHAPRDKGAPAANRYRPPLAQVEGAAASPTAGAVAAAAAAAARQAPAVYVGCSKAQREALKAQIAVYKACAKDAAPDADDLAKARPPPLPAGVAAQAGAARQFERWLEACHKHEAARAASTAGAAAAAAAARTSAANAAQAEAERKAKRDAAAAAKQQAAEDKRKREAAAKESAAERAARERAAAEAARRRAAAVASHPRLARQWPAALYFFDSDPRSKGPVPFQVKADLPAIFRAERARLLAEAREDLTARVDAALSRSDNGRALPAAQRVALLTRQRAAALLERQRALRAAMEGMQGKICAMPDRDYRKFQTNVRRYLQMQDRAAQDKHVRLWSERLAAIKDARSAISVKTSGFKEVKLLVNKAVTKAHERLGRDRAKQAGDDRALRMQALKANDMAAYQEMLRAQQGSAAAQDERYAEIESFLRETEEYLNKLSATIMEKKLSEDREKAFNAALAEARAAGVSEDAARQAAVQAANEAAEASDFLRRSENMSGDAQARYVALAHAVEEEVKQPRMLLGPGGARLREYQLVGLKWMVSLYNNNLNGILADEMGLGKTVQVMALVAHLMEEKNNYGPHLIVVPNAVLVNWKAELGVWLPDCRCVYYAGSVAERKAMYRDHVETITFNCLVTTYEFVLRDQKQLSKVPWKYLVIDEAQRMKDRDSKLAKAFDTFAFDKRLLLTGTPLQNELRELWSLLNLLLPQLFNDKAQFARWFGDALAKSDKAAAAEEALIANEKRVVVVNRLHQILEPFMLRRQVQDVEGKLPEKVTITIKCPMTGYQAAIYNWVNATALLRIDPLSDTAQRTGQAVLNLKNKVMELRKVCNHPLITYPPDGYASTMLRNWAEVDGRIVSECGKMVHVDRLIVKFFRTGHRVLLFSTMTKVLDLMEAYLRWRTVDGKTIQFRRIDGGSALEDRERAIQDFNAPGSDVFIFLLSIRAAGRGLNLQTADTVIMYDPDANPKNEEQAVARSHRIGQKKPVRVVHLETVADAPPDAVQVADDEYAEDEGADGGELDAAAAEAARAAAAAVRSARPGIGAVANAITDVRRNTTKYADSVESVYRHVIQKQKNDMAAEIIDAGRFDRQTTNDERKETLEQILADEKRNRIAKNEVPTWDWINRRLARSPEEYALFCKIDEEEAWVPPVALVDSPEWIRFTAADVEAAAPQRKRRRNELDAPQMVGPSWLAKQDTIDAVTGRRVRQASQAASQAIAETVHWFQHNPYRVSAADGAGDAGAAPRPDGAANGTAASPHGKPEGGAEGEAAGGSEHVDDDDMEEERDDDDNVDAES